MSKKTKSTDVRISCGCAVGNLSEISGIEPIRNAKIKVSKKNLKKDLKKKKIN